MAAVVFFVVTNVFFEQLLKLFSCTEDVYPYAISYGRIILIGLPFSMIATAMASIIRADGSPGYSMVCVSVGALLNIVLDYIAVFVLNLGIEGAGYATIIGQIVSFFVSIIYLSRMKSIQFSIKDIRPSRNIIRILGFGIASLFTQMTVVIMSTVMNTYLTKYGVTTVYGSDIPLSIFGIVTKVNQIFISIVIGISVGAQPLLGFFYGSKNLEKVKSTIKLGMIVCIIVAIAASVLFIGFPGKVLGLFGNESELYNELGVRFFRIFLMLTVLDGITIACCTFFQSLGMPIQSAICSASRQLILFIPILIVMTRSFGFDGILYTAPIADMIAFLIAMILFVRLWEYKLNRIEV